MDANLYEKIYGSLIGAAIGDALAAPTELRSHNQIKDFFQGEVREFKTPPNDNNSKGRLKGQITDAFGIPYTILNYLSENDVKLDKETALNGLIEWGKDEELLERFAGLTTKKVINKLIHGDERMSYWQYSGQLGNKLYKTHYYALSTNGAAIKAILVPLLYREEKDIIDKTVELTMTSHDDKYSISGACAISMLLKSAFNNSLGIDKIIDETIKGARIGEKIGKEIALDYPGPSVTKRIEMALEIVTNNYDSKICLENLRNLIGSGPAISETVPITIALITLFFNSPMESLYAAVNMGDETCAIATIVGAFFGIRNGKSMFEKEWIDLVIESNNLKLDYICNFIIRNRENS